MKNEKIVPKSKEKNSSSQAKTTSTKKAKNMVAPDNIAAPGASEIKKPRAGRGLANEGTVVSYEHER
jgi:hypothetical protein